MTCERDVGLSRKIVFTIPDKWEDTWKKLSELYGVSDEDLLWELVKDEVVVVSGKAEKKAYERIEAAAREIHRELGADYLDRFSREVELLAKKLVESMVG